MSESSGIELVDSITSWSNMNGIHGREDDRINDIGGIYIITIHGVQ